MIAECSSAALLATYPDTTSFFNWCGDGDG